VLVGLFLWAAKFDMSVLDWPAGAVFESFRGLMTGYLLTGLVCIAAVLMCLVQSRPARVLVLGTCGFSVVGVYYFYQAPDLALTQISIEIVSLILFLLVLSLLPREAPRDRGWVPVRLLIALAVGATMFWVTLISSVDSRGPMPYLTAEGRPLAHLGEFFLRNTGEGHDTAAWPNATGVGVVNRTVHGEAHVDAAHGQTRPLHAGGGGNNAVNVILVDGRGFDTMGEITVLGLAALGVWTLLRRPRRAAVGSAGSPTGDGQGDQMQQLDEGDYSRIDIPEPDGSPDPEDVALARVTEGGAQS